MSKTKDRILVVEDDVDVQEMLMGFFRPKGYEIMTYSDAQEAFEALSNRKVECDVILTDLMLPTISGIEFTKKLRDSDVDVPIILMTAQKKVEVAVEAIQAGAYDFVVKPLHFPQLLVSVERALHLNRVKSENTSLKTAVQLHSGVTSVTGIIGRSQGLRNALDLAQRVASSTSNVLITGESGTGKEVIAKAVHNMGARKKAEFVAINCSSIPENLLESELFGHAKGSFTGAVEKRIGLFEAAEGGTLFLDEIGDLGPSLQTKLLRVLQERKIKRVGENVMRPVNVRIIAATHKDLRAEIAAKRFREDLFFRLNVIPIWIPPLRERKEDIIPLAEFFVKKFSALNDLKPKSFSKEALEALLANSWQGNVRELENTIERAVVLAKTEVIDITDVEPIEHIEKAEQQGDGFDFSTKRTPVMTIEELTRRYVKYVLELNKGAKEKTARDLNIDRKTLYRRISEMQQ